MSNHETHQEGRIRDIVFKPIMSHPNLSPILYILIDLKRSGRLVKLDSQTTKAFIKAFSTKLSFWLGKTVMYSSTDNNGQSNVSVYPVKH